MVNVCHTVRKIVQTSVYNTFSVKTVHNLVYDATMRNKNKRDTTTALTVGLGNYETNRKLLTVQQEQPETAYLGQ